MYINTFKYTVMYIYADYLFCYLFVMYVSDTWFCICIVHSPKKQLCSRLTSEYLPLLRLPCFFRDMVSHWNWNLLQLNPWPTRPSSLSACVPSHIQCWGQSSVLPCAIITWTLMIQTPFLMLLWHMLCKLNHLSNKNTLSS